MQSSSQPRALTIAQVADEWEVTDRTVRAWIANGLPTRTHDGKKWILDTDVRTHFAALIAAYPEEKTRRKQRRVKRGASS